ncbi:MAG TPA: UdgX family uracil-DNA binding protein [Gemmatimonadaceae bacterium]|nr:UdgX family uracil-DNA binding protein [Gemmatimonadaceae bacterium]
MKPKRTASSGRSAAPTRRAKAGVAGAPCTDRTARVTGSAADFVPPNPTIPKLRAAAHGCRGCALFLCGTGAVFGEGPRGARVMVVGEQPGDMEDRAGKVFVGPAGKLLDRAFAEAGIARSELYLTNAVKHFKWAREAGSKRRIHKTPSAGEVKACFPWLEMEMQLLRPDVIVCLGAVASRAIIGSAFSVMKSRGKPMKSRWAPVVIATVHPSAVLRAPREERDEAMETFVADLRKVRVAMRRSRRAA